MPKFNHEDLEAVLNVIYRKGTITAVDSENDTADVTTFGGSTGSDVPIYYHCEPDSELRSNGAIEGGAGAFNVDDEVIVMCDTDGKPLRVVGFVDGIKECKVCYLLIYSKFVPLSMMGIFTVWDVAEGKVADIYWDDEKITFPYEGNIASLVDGNPNLDPLYLWLMNRPGEIIGFNERPMVTVYDVFMFRYPEQSFDNSIPVSASCLPACSLPYFVHWPYPGYIEPGVPEASCSDSDSASVLSWDPFGSDYGLTNDGVMSVSGSCVLHYDPYTTGNIYDEQYTLSYAATRQATDFSPSVTFKGIGNSGPFVSLGMAFASSPGDIVISRVIRQESTQTGHHYSDSLAVYGWTGAKTETYSRTFSFAFITPLGSLDTISVSGEYSYSNTEPMSSGGFPVFRGEEAVISQTLRDAEWVGVEVSGFPMFKKNMAMFKSTDKVMFQIYYYSTKISSVTWNKPYGESELGGTYTGVLTPCYTSLRAAVTHFPNRNGRDPEINNPNTAAMAQTTPTSAFEEAIQAVFDAVMAHTELGGIVMNLEVEVYN